ncbi:MAG: GDP-mannose 4,6-dehydratase, partial [Candidatus Cloacimonetes bacterium]|nr:GDP-mannose 4,6-dehydratase [Candidatus Cloacimonadota bacterium]
SVYGNNEKVPFCEDDSVDNPISPYAATKKAAELHCHTYHVLHDIAVVCLRFFTVFGPRQRPDLAIHKFTEQIILGNEITIYGKGDMLRDYTYVDDIINGIMLSIDYIFIGKKYQIFNLGASHPVTVNEMIDILEKTLQKKAKRKNISYQLGDVFQTYADISKSKKFLKYQPQISFEEGVKRFLEWKKGN